MKKIILQQVVNLTGSKVDNTLIICYSVCITQHSKRTSHMKFRDQSLTMAYQMGSYQSIAEMMRDRIRELDSAEDDFDREWATKRLIMLADQFDETKEKFQKAVDMA